jgi:chaperonin GroES
MKLLGISSIILATTLSGTEGFIVSSSKASFQRNQVISNVNVLDGKEIEKDFTPVNNMIVVKKGEIIDQTGGGIFLTGKEKIDKSEGEVVSTGTGRINSETGFQSPMPVSIGDTVLFGEFSGEELKYNGATHTLIRDDDVLVKFPAGADHQTMDNAEVIWDSVLVKVEETNDMESGSSILISATVKKASVSSIGEVQKVGAGRFAFNGELMPMDVVPGDMVKFRDFAAQTVEIDGEEFAVVRMNDLLAKF